MDGTLVTVLLGLLACVALVALVLALVGYDERYGSVRATTHANVSGHTSTRTLAVHTTATVPQLRAETLTVSDTTNLDQATARQLTATAATLTDADIQTLRVRDVLPAPPAGSIELAKTHVTELAADALTATNATVQALAVTGTLNVGLAQSTTVQTTTVTAQTVVATGVTADAVNVTTQLTAEHASIGTLEVTEAVTLSPTLSSLSVGTLESTLPKQKHVSARAVDASAAGFVAQLLGPASPAVPLGLNVAIAGPTALGPTYATNSGLPNNLSTGGQWNVPQAGLYAVSATVVPSAAVRLDMEWVQASQTRCASSSGTQAVASLTSSGLVALNAGSVAVFVRNNSASLVTVQKAEASLVLVHAL
jgi:hypothetical protein